MSRPVLTMFTVNEHSSYTGACLERNINACLRHTNGKAHTHTQWEHRVHATVLNPYAYPSLAQQWCLQLHNRLESRVVYLASCKHGQTNPPPGAMLPQAQWNTMISEGSNKAHGTPHRWAALCTRMRVKWHLIQKTMSILAILEFHSPNLLFRAWDR